MDIILYLLQVIQDLYQQNCWLILFICKYIPLKQWAFDDSHSPKYQKFRIDELPKIISFQQDWNWLDLISYYQQRYHKTVCVAAGSYSRQPRGPDHSWHRRCYQNRL